MMLNVYSYITQPVGKRMEDVMNYDERSIEETKQCQDVEVMLEALNEDSMKASMRKLSPLETHKMIKDAVPDAETVYQRSNKGQMTFAELYDGWEEYERPLKDEAPELHQAFIMNIRRKQI